MKRTTVLGLSENTPQELDRARDQAHKHATDQDEAATFLHMLGLAPDPHRIRRNPIHGSKIAAGQKATTP